MYLLCSEREKAQQGERHITLYKERIEKNNKTAAESVNHAHLINVRCRCAVCSQLHAAIVYRWHTPGENRIPVRLFSGTTERFHRCRRREPSLSPCFTLM